MSFSTNSFSSTKAALFKAKQLKSKTFNQVTSLPVQRWTSAYIVCFRVRQNSSDTNPRGSMLGKISLSTLPMEATQAQRRGRFYF